MSQGGVKSKGGNNSRMGTGVSSVQLTELLEQGSAEEFRKCFQPNDHSSIPALNLLRQICERQGRVNDENKKVELLLDNTDM